MPKNIKNIRWTKVELIGRLVGLIERFGPGFDHDPSSTTFIKAGGLKPSEVTPTLVGAAYAQLRSARDTSRQEAVQANKDGRRPIVIWEGDHLLDPEFNPEHPIPGRAKFDADIKAATEAAKKERFAQLKAAKAEAKGEEPPRRKPTGPSLRLRVFELLYKIRGRNQIGYTGVEVKTLLTLGSIPGLLKDEICCNPPRIQRKRKSVKGQKSAVYSLTKEGIKALNEGTVDSGAAPSSSGKNIPEGR